MSSVRFHFPKIRLAEILTTPGGVTVAEALERAQENLAEIRPVCFEDLLALLDLAEASFGRLGAAFDDAGMADLYGVAVRGIGAGSVCGAPRVDDALTSLCDLLDHLRTSDTFDRQAIGVHVRAWRLLMNPELAPEEAQAVLDGLRKVTEHFSAGAGAP